MKKIFFLLLTVLSLSGCIPVALVVGATAGGAVVYDKRDIKTQAFDRNATSAASSRLNEDAYLKGQAHLDVAVFNRTALIVGQVTNPDSKDRAYQLVSTIKGIHQVYNQITIEPAISRSARANDAWITTQVKTAMLATKNLQSTQIKVVTENHVVYLMGVVSHEQADLATEVARDIAGVEKVVKVFQYT